MATSLSCAACGDRGGALPDQGTLVLVVGPSGVGKDSLIDYARARLDDDPLVVFPRRVITRPDGDDAEDHDSIAEADFDRLAADDAFALHWRAHGLGYGIPRSIVDDLAAGRSVVVNASRTMIDEARRRFDRVLVVSVVAPVDVLAERLARRGRETPERIRLRLERLARVPIEGADVLSLDNSGPIERAGDRLVGAVAALAGVAI